MNRSCPRPGVTPNKWQAVAASEMLYNPELCEGWDRLNAACGNLAVLSSEMLRAALSTLANGPEVLLVGHDGSGKPVVMAVVMPQGRSDGLAGPRLPEPCRPVIASCQGDLAIVAQPHGMYTPIMR